MNRLTQNPIHCRAGTPIPALREETLPAGRQCSQQAVASPTGSAGAPPASSLAPRRGLESPPYTQQRGSVILFVLGLILLTALLLTQFIDRAHTELLTEARRSQLAPLREEAYSALQVSFASLADFAALDQGLNSPAQGWGEPLAHADYTPPLGFAVTAEIIDDTGRLSLVNRDPAALQALLRELGVSATDADAFIEAYLAWTESEAIARSLSGMIDAGDDTPVLTAPQAALRSYEELRFIPAIRDVLCDEQGDWNETGRAFLANVTLHPVNVINLNSASPELLSALGYDPATVAAQREAALGPTPNVFYSTADLSAAAGAPVVSVGTDATLLRIRITTAYGARRFSLDVVVESGRGGNQSRPEDPDAAQTEPRPWTRNSIDSGFRILEIRENSGA
jgi:type II secretory pathway component PulK